MSILWLLCLILSFANPDSSWADPQVTFTSMLNNLKAWASPRTLRRGKIPVIQYFKHGVRCKTALTWAEVENGTVPADTWALKNMLTIMFCVMRTPFRLEGYSRTCWEIWERFTLEICFCNSPVIHRRATESIEWLIPDQGENSEEGVQGSPKVSESDVSCWQWGTSERHAIESCA